jgi:hypothetical protein
MHARPILLRCPVAAFFARTPPIISANGRLFIMSAWGQKRTRHQRIVMSALPPRADIHRDGPNVPRKQTSDCRLTMSANDPTDVSGLLRRCGKPTLPGWQGAHTQTSNGRECDVRTMSAVPRKADISFQPNICRDGPVSDSVRRRRMELFDHSIDARKCS